MDVARTLPALPDPVDVAADLAMAIGHGTRFLALERIVKGPCRVTDLVCAARILADEGFDGRGLDTGQLEGKEEAA